MTTQFKFGSSQSDFTDMFIPRDIFSQGGLWVSGRREALGDNTAVTKSSPVQTVAAGTTWILAFSGNYSGGGIKTDGTLWLWGSNGFGNLGTGGAATSSPVQTAPASNLWKMAGTNLYNSGGIKTDGTLWMWGQGNRGQIGNNATTQVNTPVQTTVGGANWKQLSVGGQSPTAIKTDGTLWNWGFNAYGQLGNSLTANVSTPVQTTLGGTNWKQVSASSAHKGAIKTDGTLWMWGYNLAGQLGNNVGGNASTPIQTVSSGTNWKMVACGAYHTAAIKTDGTLWTWGQNGVGQLGDNTSVNKSSPVQTVASGSNWKRIGDFGQNSSCAVKTDGTLWLWGSNNLGQLADNSTVNRSSPVQAVTSGNNWKMASAGNQSFAGIRDYATYY